MFTTAITSVMLAGIAVTGNYPGVESIGLEEDHPAVVAALEAHAEPAPGICMDAVGTTVDNAEYGFSDFPAEFLVDGNCEPLVDWLEVF